MTLPGFATCEWPVDTACCEEFDTYPMPVQVRATAMAAATLRRLTAYRVGGCPITVRPCRQGCAQDWWPPYKFGAVAGFGNQWNPGINFDGLWVNNFCDCSGDCSCSALTELKLPTPVGRIDQVLMNGVVVASSNYRLDFGGRLVWLGTAATGWLTCQDMNKAAVVGVPAGLNTMSVTYLNAYPVDGIGAYAAGVLACEFARACNGGKCRLPTGVTNIVRQGISMTVIAGAFPGGLTGIREVDAYITTWNPRGVVQGSTVFDPGARHVR